jgi:hypothetical protein
MDESPLIKFRCESCGQRISAPRIYAGQKNKCPGCKNTLVIPLTGDSDHSDIGLKSLLDPAMFDIPPGQAKDQKPPAPPPEQPSPHKAEDAPEPILDAAVFDIPPEPAEPEKTAVDYFKKLEEPPPQRKLPWFIDVFLYPINTSGIIHILVFVFIPLLLSLFFSFLTGFISSPYAQSVFVGTIGFIAWPFYIIFYGYFSNYIIDCLIDSARGALRTPDTSGTDIPDMGDLFSRTILLLGCAAICLGPAAVYYLVIRQTDSIFRLLEICGIVFLPMSLLRGILFDSFSELNPLLIIQSIYRTFFSYCGLVFFILGVIMILSRIPVRGFLQKGIQIYVVFVIAHLLGRFYWINKERLDWGI